MSSLLLLVPDTNISIFQPERFFGNPALKVFSVMAWRGYLTTGPFQVLWGTGGGVRL